MGYMGSLQHRDAFGSKGCLAQLSGDIKHLGGTASAERKISYKT